MQNINKNAQKPSKKGWALIIGGHQAATSQFVWYLDHE
tara:strand:+ start:25689 stop:25802 length:114 start_codon:yes stop_codon:yes gene_type:complete